MVRAPLLEGAFVSGLASLAPPNVPQCLALGEPVADDPLNLAEVMAPRQPLHDARRLNINACLPAQTETTSHSERGS